MVLNQRKEAFIKLGLFLSQFSTEGITKKEDILFNDLFFDAFKMQISRAKEFNGWFNQENVLFSLASWSKALTNDNIEKWISAYEINKLSASPIAL